MITVNKYGEDQIVVMPGETVDMITKQMFLIAMHNNGSYMPAVSKALGVCAATVKRWNKEWGFENDKTEETKPVQTPRSS